MCLKNCACILLRIGPTTLFSHGTDDVDDDEDESKVVLNKLAILLNWFSFLYFPCQWYILCVKLSKLFPQLSYSVSNYTSSFCFYFPENYLLTHMFCLLSVFTCPTDSPFPQVSTSLYGNCPAFTAVYADLLRYKLSAIFLCFQRYLTVA